MPNASLCRNASRLGVAIALERLLDAWASADMASNLHRNYGFSDQSWLCVQIGQLCYERAKSLMRDAIVSLDLKRARHLTANLAVETGEYVNLVRGWRRVYPDLLEV